MERFNPRQLNELEVRKQHQNKISNRSVALENLSDSEDTNRAWENGKENIKISAEESLGVYKLKQHKSWFVEECLHFQIKGSMLRCGGHRIQAQAVQII
jgi:hypothetical protein